MGPGFEIEDAPTTTEASFALDEQVVGGRFRLLERLSWGGMGTVYRAVDLDSGREVAVKLPHLGAPGATDARFEREVQAVASLMCSSVIGYVGHGSEEEPFLAMELVLGEPLYKLLQDGPLPERAALVVARRVASALATMHIGGWLHRDVKPGNIVVSMTGEVKLLDFGLSRSLDPEQASSTAKGDLVGTLGYMAPEQLRGKPVVDARTDVFSLGVVLYECLTGRRAYNRTMATVARGASEPPLDVRGAGIEGPTAALLESMIAHSPDARPADGVDALARMIWMTSPADAPSNLAPVRHALHHAIRSGAVSLVGPFAGSASDAALGVAVMLAEIQAPVDVVVVACDPSYTSISGSHATSLSRAFAERGFTLLASRLATAVASADRISHGAVEPHRRVVVVLEDAPWCDPASAAALASLAQSRAITLVASTFASSTPTLLPGWASVAVDHPPPDETPFARLSPLARWVLRAASMFGRSVPARGVMQLVDGREADDVAPVLSHLATRRVLLPLDGGASHYHFASGISLDLARNLATPGETRLGTALAHAYRATHDALAAPRSTWVTSSEERFPELARSSASSR